MITVKSIAWVFNLSLWLLVVTISIENYGSTDSPFDQNHDNLQVDALTELMTYPFLHGAELGLPIGKYNGAIRVDVTKLTKSRIVRSPGKVMKLIGQLSKESSTIPSYGLEVKFGNRKEYIHYLLELNEENSVGIFYFDSKRMLAVNQIHKVERLVNYANLTGAIIIANNIGIPAKQEAARINQEHDEFGIITIEQYSSIEKRCEDIF